MDFRRISPDDRWLYKYRCGECAFESEFIIELPPHMRDCCRDLHVYRRNRCRGKMEFVSVRPDDGNTSTTLPELRHETKMGEIDHAEDQMDHEESLGLHAQAKQDHEASKAEKEQQKMNRKIGSYKARAVGSVLGVAGTGTEQIVVTFEITEDGPRKGERHPWYGFFTDNTTSRTLESLENAGWDGDSLDQPKGLGRIECEVVLGEEEYNGQSNIRVQWVNRPGGGGVKNVMTAEEARSFNERMRGEIQARKLEKAQRGSQPAGSNAGAGDGTDFNFGASAGPVGDKPPV